MNDELQPTGGLFQVGDLVNNTYRIEALLGRGGTSDVYRARSEISGRVVAIKVLRAEFAGDLDYLSLLTREEEIREIRHDAVVRYSENHKTPEGHVYLLMDYVDGPGLDRKLREGGMSAEDLLVVCRRVAGGLQAAHTRNIVHRDLSPDNIILKNDDPAQATIIDFGIAKDTNPGAETIVGNEFAGKYAYAAPEQLAGRSDPRTDIYSLGALLLACFRGRKPEIGANPMEVLKKKGEPLDLSGVPEPLRALLARMTHPDPAKRFQSAAEVIAAIDRGSVAPAVDSTMEDDERTVIMPPPRAASKPAPPPPPRRKSRLPVIVGLLVVLALAALGGIYGMNRFGPTAYPAVTPYALRLDRPEGQALTASGYVPSPETQLAIEQIAESDGGVATLTLASGDIGPDWGAGVVELLGILDPLDAFLVELEGNAARITGETADRSTAEAVQAALAAGLPGGLTGQPEITFLEPFLAVEPIRAALDRLADCGPLELVDPPETGYGPGSAVAVRGLLSSDSALASLNGQMSAILGDRPLAVEVDILNAELCLVQNFLPPAPTSGVSFRFSEGSGPVTERQEATFRVGETPVLDVILPAGMVDGYLSATLVDVSGMAFHFLPNRARPDNDIATLRAGRDGAVPVRLTYPASENSASTRAIGVDPSSLGKSEILVIHSTEPLFDPLRPISESAAGYAQALSDGQRNPAAQILSIDRQILDLVE